MTGESADIGGATKPLAAPFGIVMFVKTMLVQITVHRPTQIVSIYAQLKDGLPPAAREPAVYI